MNRVSDVTVATLAPGAILPVARPGDFYYFIEASGGPLSVKTNRDGWKPYTVGRGLSWKTREFRNCEIRNDSASPVRFAFYSGFCRYRDRRLNVYGGSFGDRPAGPLILPAPRALCSTGSVSLANLAEYNAGIEGVQCEITAFPLDGGTLGVVKDGVIIDVITASHLPAFQSSGEITFRNISGSEKLFVFFSQRPPGFPCPTPPPDEPAGLQWEWLNPFISNWEVYPGGVFSFPDFAYEGGGLPTLKIRATNLGDAPVGPFTGSASSTTPSAPPPALFCLQTPDEDPIPPAGTKDFELYNPSSFVIENGPFLYTLTVDGHTSVTQLINFTYSS